MGWITAKLFWKALPWLLLAAAIAGATIWIKLLQGDKALLVEQKTRLVEELGEVVAANKESEATITTLRLERIKDREATLRAQEREAALSKNLETAKKEMRNAPEANAPAGSFFDAVGDSLRGLDSQRGHEEHD